jgi:hypothetical protein
VARRLPDFITGFCAFAKTYNTTSLFAKYAAIWLLGTACTRAVGMKSRGNDLHMNFFFQLVGGPGTGKSQAVKAVRKIMIPATKFSVIPASITRAGLEDYMVKNLQTRRSPNGSPLMVSECIGLSEEMQGILPDQDLGHLTLYNILYDLPNLHMAVTRSNGEVRLESPYCSILTGAQPAFLATTMPEQAWGMGFMSRSVMIFDQPRERTSMFNNPEFDHKLEADLVADLKEIFGLTGWMTWTKAAIALYEEWFVVNGGQPIPQAKRLAMGYNARRELHMTKLAMALSVSQSNDLVVDVHHVSAAIELLLLTEDRMRMVFTEMSSTGSMVAIEDALDVVRANSAADKHTDEAILIEMLMQRFAPTQVHAVIENLVSSQALKNVGAMDARGFRKFKIGGKANVL